MVVALSSAGSFARNLARERTALTVAGSVLLHLALGWFLVSLLVVRAVPEPPEPMTIEIAPPMALPAPAPPSVTHDSQETKADKPRGEIGLPAAESVPFEQAAASPPADPPAGSGASDGPEAAGVPPGPPTAAPRPTYRAPMTFPYRAELAGRTGSAVVEILVGAGGAVTDLRIVSEAPSGWGFGEAAAESVWKWRFESAKPGVYRVTVRFTLD